MEVSGRIQFGGVKVGDTLVKYLDGGFDGPQVIGVVVGKTTNSKGKAVLVLDRVSFLGSDRLGRSAFGKLTIRKVVG